MKKLRTSLRLLLALAVSAAPAAGATRLGLEPVPDVHLVEEQSEALCRWYKAGLRGLPLVHVSVRLNIASQQMDAPGDGAAARAALAGGSCEELAARTGSILREDALWDTDNFLVPAHLLGVVSEVWWVVPGRGSLAEAALPAFRDRLRESFGLPVEFLDSLRQEGAVVHGTYRGLPVHIVTLADLPGFSEPVLAGIDAEYLLSIYDNPVRERLLDLLAGFFATLRARAIRADQVAVSVSNRSGRVPLEYAYLAIQVRDYLAAPGRFGEGPPEAWRLQSQVEYLSYMAGREDAEREARRLAAIDPDSPVPWYDLAQIAAGRGEAPVARHMLSEAVRRSTRYRTGYPALARILSDRQMAGPAQELLEAGCAAFPDDVSLGLALAVLYAERGSLDLAAAHLTALAGRLPRYPAVHAALALALRESGKAAEAEAAMENFRRTAPAGGMRRSFVQEPGGAAKTPDRIIFSLPE